MSEETRIEVRLMECGWVQSSSAPLVLGVSLMHHITATKQGADGKECHIGSLRVRRAGERYVMVWTELQDVEPGTKQGFPFNGVAEFDPTTDAVAAGFAHAMTINLATSSINFWLKPSGGSSGGR